MNTCISMLTVRQNSSSIHYLNQPEIVMFAQSVELFMYFMYFCLLQVLSKPALIVYICSIFFNKMNSKHYQLAITIIIVCTNKNNVK